MSLLDIKNHIAAQLDSDNDGIRTSAIKFLEMLIIALSPRIKESLVPFSNDQDFSIDQIDERNTINLDKSSLQEEGRHHLRKLLEYTLSTHISSVNLISSICVLSNIAKQRPEFMEAILEAYSKIIANMPPTLGKSQVNTVRKQMKLQLVLICKNPCCIEFQSKIISIFNELGASQSEISKALPKISSNEMRKRLISQTSSQEQQANNFLNKKAKIQATIKTTTKEEAQTKQADFESVVDDLVAKLSIADNVADIVLVSMAFLPEQMSSTFQNSYKPISAAGTLQQIKNLAKMLAVYLNESGLLQYNNNNSVVTLDDDLDNEDDLDLDLQTEFKSCLIKTEKLEAFDSSNMDTKHLTKPTTTTTTTSLNALPANLNCKKVSSSKTFKLADITNSTISQFNSQSLNELFKKLIIEYCKQTKVL